MGVQPSDVEPEEPTDRRTAPRLEIGLPAELNHGMGWTRDVSASGVYFETDGSFAPGTPLTLTLVLTYAHSPLRLRCEGQIARVEQRDGKIGVAVALTSSRFERHATPPPPTPA